MKEENRSSCTESLLTYFEDCSNAYDWNLQNHGIKIRFNSNGRNYSGTYLPQVATEQGWNQEETLVSLVRKAGFKGQINADFINSLSVTRYQSQTCSFSRLVLLLNLVLMRQSFRILYMACASCIKRLKARKKKLKKWIQFSLLKGWDSTNISRYVFVLNKVLWDLKK
ncbi:unnamed protein product [Oikopleura dioica]|uniref:AMMECR1 domain-containing protein n=1 Tax=Oikopleura dioica TaxID=34765 RepID=E4Z4Q3_OIKDI|nr:unnamed protein product [Oikopleura dioica]